MTEEVDGRGPILSLLNAMKVLRAIHPNEPLGVTEIAREVGLPKGSVQRILVTLHADGWVTPTLKSPTRWLAAGELFALSAKFRKGWDLRPTALPIMRALRDRTGETVNLGLLRAEYIVWIEQVRSLHALGVTNAVGGLVPCYASAAGKAILAQLPEDQVRAIVGDMRRKITRRTITDIDALLVDLSAIRRRGYAVTTGEGQEGVVGIGAMITGSEGDPVAAISIAAPLTRVTKSRIAEVGRLVMGAAAEIGAEIA